MTPKEKAKELYAKYDFVYIQNYTSKREVIECCLIAVRLLKETFEKQTEGLIHSDDPMSFDTLQYWNDVERELELLNRS